MAARARRGQSGQRADVRLQWFINDVLNKVNLPLKQRTMLATEVLRRTVVQNISRPVTKAKSKRTGRIVVSDRSKPGEFPKADTTLLMKTIFGETRNVSEGVYDGYVGTPIDYGLRLELHMDRSFLRRTFNDMLPTITRILTGPIK